MFDDPKWYEDALAGNRRPVSPGKPQQGLFRSKRGRVAFWPDSQTGKLRCQVNDRDIPENSALELWDWAHEQLANKADFLFHRNNGRWPDEAEAVVGHNRAPVEDTLEAIQDRIEDLARQAEEVIATGAAKDAVACNQASDWAQIFGELEAKADRLFTEEKAPHLAAGRAVEDKWRGVRERAKDLKTRLKRLVVTPFQVAEERRKQEAAAKAIASGADPVAVDTSSVKSGATKRTTALRTHKRAQVDDRDALHAALKDHPEILELEQSIADASARAGVALAGTTIVTERISA